MRKLVKKNKKKEERNVLKRTQETEKVREIYEFANEYKKIG